MAAFFSGTDPEFFIKDKDGNLVPAWKFFPDKQNKVELVDPNTGYHEITAFHDGAAVEVNIPGMWCRGNMVGMMLKAIKGIQERLPAGYTLCSLPAMKLKLPDDMKDAPDDCQIFGCDPSWNAYTGEYGGLELDAATHPYRYAGGHMHVSVKETEERNKLWIFDKQQVPLFIKMCDKHIGLPLTVWFAKPETFLRRKYYGKAGEFRFQRYNKPIAYEQGDVYIGVEYRTPGPELWNSPVVAGFAFGALRYLAENFDTLKTQWDAGMEEDIRRAVDTGEGAENLLPKAYLPLSGSQNREEWFTRTILKDKPFQELPQEFDANTTVGHRGWDFYQMTRDLGQPYTMGKSSGQFTDENPFNKWQPKFDPDYFKNLPKPVQCQCTLCAGRRPNPKRVVTEVVR